MQFLKHETMTFLQIKEINITQRKKTNSEKSPITTNDSDVDNEKENKINNTEKIDISFSSQKTSKDSRVLIDRSIDMLITNLKEYNEKCLLEEFNLTYVFCEICFVSNSGAHCIKFR